MICSCVAVFFPLLSFFCVVCHLVEQQREHPAADELPEQAAAAPRGGA